MPGERAGPERPATDGGRLRDSGVLRDLVANLPEPIYVMTEAGRILDANVAFVELIGAESLESARAVDANTLWRDSARRGEALQELAKSGRLRDFEYELRRLDGEVRTVLNTCCAAQDRDTGTRMLYGILVDITARKQVETELRRQAIRDPLTGCYNRRFLDTLASELKPGDVCGAIVADIDHFKRYNDQFGHHAGDEVLIRLTRFLTHRVRPTDVVVRTGGDEFILVLFGQDAAHITEIASRFKETAGAVAPVPFSIGWAVRDGDESLYQTIERADQELIHVRVAERQYTETRRSGFYGAPGAH